MPFLPILGLLFLALKLTGFIAWSWWLVLLPLYGGLVAGLALMALGVFGLGLASVLEEKGRRK